MIDESFTLDQSPRPAVVQTTTELSIIEINKLHDVSQQSLRRGVMVAIMLGYRLIALKGSLPHGAFSKLFKQNGTACRFDFKERAARNYMKLYKLLHKHLKKEERPYLEHLCQDGAINWDKLQQYLEAKLPNVNTISQALLILDESKKETGTYDPSQFEADKPTDSPDDDSPLVQGMLNFNKLTQSVVQLNDWVSDKAATISEENRRIIAAQLKELADRLVTL